MPAPSKRILTAGLTTLAAAVVLCTALFTPAKNHAAKTTSPPAKPLGHPQFLSPHSNPIVVLGDHVFATNTPSDTVDVIDRTTRKVTARIPVGVDPVALAVRPGGKELWVSNHVSDSVSVIDTDPASPTHLTVVATVQDIDPETRATRFDEPVGIAFASDKKAYVALSSENRIAVVDTQSRKVTGHLDIPAQDPRAITVRNGRLYVVPFESNNKSQLSGGYEIDGELVTFNAHEHSIANNNVLSIGHVTDIVKHPRVPDRDLFVFDTETDKLVHTVDTLGTLLYGLAVDSEGRAFIAQTDARNEINGRSGTKDHSLAELENRAFLNRITAVPFPGGDPDKANFLDLEPLPPEHPAPGQALATPFAVQVSADDATLVATAAGSDKLFTVDAKSGAVLGRTTVGAVPRGVALEHGDGGKPSRAWVFNAVENSVSLVDLSDPAAPATRSTVALHDPTHPQFKRGRIAFETASASTTETFSCASCHPDGHTDQLLWVLKTPVVTDGNQIMPRSTMPLRGLRDTAPFHWDGIPGDPYGGINSANTRSHVDPNCDPDVPESAARHLVDGGLASTMMTVGSEETNDEGKAGRLSAQQRDDLSAFLLAIPFPPAQRRAYTDQLSPRAKQGFDLFHIKGDVRGTPGGNLCGNCHRMPFLVSTNTPGSGMDAPTWRGAYDRFLILPQGRLNIIDFDFYRHVAERGNDERSIWRFSWGGRTAFDPVWDMVLETSTGFSGAYARQLTLSEQTVDETLTQSLLPALEKAAAEGAVVLTAEGTYTGGDRGRRVALQFDGTAYRDTTAAGKTFTREKLVGLAREGKLVATFTGRHGAATDLAHPQPALWTLSPLHAQTGQQQFPILHGDQKTMKLNARHLDDGATVVVDGRRVPATLTAGKDENIDIKLESLPPVGMHFLQVQNPGGQFSNDFIFHVTEDEQRADDLRLANSPHRSANRLNRAITGGDLAAVQDLVRRGLGLENRHHESGMPALAAAAYRGHTDIVRFLLDSGADPNGTNRDNNTPLHIAAFLCRHDIVDLLLERGAGLHRRNNRGETPIDSVSGEWSDGLAGFYTMLRNNDGLNLDLPAIQEARPALAERLRTLARERRQRR